MKGFNRWKYDRFCKKKLKYMNSKEGLKMGKADELTRKINDCFLTTTICLISKEDEDIMNEINMFIKDKDDNTFSYVCFYNKRFYLKVIEKNK